MRAPPTVSVVVPVHNAVHYVDACIASILAQDFAEFEVVIYDDGSTDGSSEKLRTWAGRDDRVRIECGARRLGAASSSNRVVGLAEAPFIARLDADDVMLPGRLAAQAAVLDRCQNAVMVGTLAWTIDSRGRRVRAPDFARLLRISAFAPFSHSSVMFRRSAWEQAGGYRDEAEKWEDVDFFHRMSAFGQIWVIPRAYVEYRQNAATTRLIDGIEELELAMNAMVRAIEPERGGTSPRIAPLAFRHIGATLLWSGLRPRLLGRILKRCRLRVDRESVALLTWAVLAQTAPGAFRAVLRGQLALKNRWVRRRLAALEALRWHPNGSSQ